MGLTVEEALVDPVLFVDVPNKSESEPIALRLSRLIL